MSISENENLCPEPGLAAPYGGCGGRDSDPVVPRNFPCQHPQCPRVAQAAAYYGFTVASAHSLKVRAQIGGAEIVKLPANDNTALKAD